MRTTIDRAGRVVVPKEMRARLRLLGGGEVEVTERDGVIEIVPVPAQVEVRDTLDGVVAMSVEVLPALTDAELRAALDDVRR